MVLVVALVPYGPLLAVITLMAAAAWQGRDRTPPAPEGPDEHRAQRLSSLYEALVPYFSVPEDPDPLYAHGGAWEKAFPAYEFDDSGRFSHLVIRYPAYFTDGEAESRARIEHLLTAKAGRGREYHYAWDEEANHLTVTVLAPLPTDIAAQRFVTAPARRSSGSPTRPGCSARSRSPTARSSGTCRRSSGAPASAPPSRTCWSWASRAPVPPPCCAPSPCRPCTTAATW